MNQTVKDNKQKRQVEFMAQHTLTRDQFQKLIEGKFARAYEYHQALRKREMLCERR